MKLSPLKTSSSTPAIARQNAPPLVMLINMDRSRERLAATAGHLKARNVKFKRLPAVDGALADVSQYADPEHYRRCHGRYLRASEVGCYVSHLQAMQEFLNTEAQVCAILEDDARVTTNFADLIAELTGKELCGFDVLRLQGRRKGLGFVAVETSRWAIKVHATRVTGSTGYLINRRAARRYLDRMLPMEVPFDHAFDRARQLELRIGAVLPYPVTADDGPSTIETGAGNSRAGKVRGLARRTILAWRCRTETGRVANFLREYARSKLSV